MPPAALSAIDTSVSLINCSRCLLVLVGLLAGRAACAVADVASPMVPATLAADTRSFSFTAAGVSGFRGGFSATIKVGVHKHVLTSTDGVVAGVTQRLTEETPYGPAEVSATTLRFAEPQVELLFRLGHVAGVPGVLAQAGIRNAGSQPVNLLTVTPVAAALQVAGAEADWLVTGMDPVNGCETMLSDIHTPLQVWEYGSLYRRDGAGLLFGPVGTPSAYLNTRVTHTGERAVTLDITSQMSGVRVDAGETRWGQQVVLLLEPPQPALARWATWVGKSHRARTAKGALSGWSSWYFLAGDVSGKDVLDISEAAAGSADRLRPEVIQIDEGYENLSGEMEANEKFPEGLAYYAQRIAAAGARPGLQLGLPVKRGKATRVDAAGWSGLAGRIRHAVQGGFSYLKLNFYGVEIMAGEDTYKTSFEVMREGFTKLRDAAGENVYLLYCNFQPDRATVGLVDASRTGVAADRNSVRSAMGDVLRSYQLHERWFAVDNGNYYMGTDITNVSAIAGGWPLVRTWMSMVGLSCGTATTSDPWQWESFKPNWRNVEVLTPPARERCEVLDLGTSNEWPRLVGHVKRAWGDSTVALLWNPGSTEQAITLDFAQAGMDVQRRYAVWSFWDNRYLGVTKGSWTTPTLAPSASQHLCFTDLDREPNKPLLVGSNLHIFCGAAETKRVTSGRGAMQIELTDAGAREGYLFIYSRLPLVLNAASGLEVTGIAQAGEFMWRVGIAGRQRSAVQRLDFIVLLPVTQQLWFWLLIASVVLSLAFAASRWFIGLRFQRQHALDQERVRIARDLHDEIGANLSHISILSSLAAKPSTESSISREHNAEVANVARQTILAFDEILWSINPGNDTLSSLSHFICRRTEEILAPGKLTCQFELDESFPERFVPPQLRHGLLLAVKEALHNILKHAAATRVEVSCVMQGKDFLVRISDNGCGFDPQAVASTTHARQGHGLVNMRRRLAELGGDCRLESSIGSGTRITFRLPLY
ncbi:MAG: ATP-binding protein [Verrucomicrobiota bacterium]